MKYSAYPAYKNSGVEWLGEIPAHWEVKRLKFIAYIQSGVAKGRDLGGRNIVELPYLRVANVQDGYLDLSDIAKITVGKDEVERYLLRAGDVLMNEGGDYDKLGRGAVWQGQIEPCIHQNHVYAVRPHKGIDPYWINTVTLTSYAKHYFILKSKQSTNLASISSSNLKKLPVVIPPVSECKAIAFFLDSETAKIDALITKKERLIELLQEKRTAIISHAVTKGLDPSVALKDSGVNLYPSVPMHWTILRLRYLCKKVADGPHFSPAYVEEGEGIMFLSARNVKVDGWSLDDAKYVSEEDYREFCKRIVPEVGDILYTKGGTTGIARVVDLTVPFQVWVHIAVLKLKQEKVNPYFLAYVLNSAACYGQSQLYTRGATNNDLGLTRLINIVLAIPPKAEQQQIVTYLDRETAKIDALIAKIREGIEKLKEYRTALISAAVTGKIDVRNEVAS